jgi:hypothetical protein
MKNTKLFYWFSIFAFMFAIQSCDKIEDDVKQTTLEVGNNRKIIFHCNNIGTAFEYTRLFQEGNGVNITLISSPQLGTLEPIGDKVLRYTPDTTIMMGLDSFKISIKKDGKTSQRTIYLNITGSIPCTQQAVSDNFTLEFSQFANGTLLDILSNDQSCLSGIDSESKAIESAPTRGSVNLSAFGSTSGNLVGNSINYFPTVGFRGISFFTYKIKNSRSENQYDYANVKVRTMQTLTCDPVAIDDNVYWNRKSNDDNIFTINVASNDNTCVPINSFLGSINPKTKVLKQALYGDVNLFEGRAVYTLGDKNATYDEFTYELRDNQNSPPSTGKVKIFITKLTDCQTILSQDYIEVMLSGNPSFNYPVLRNDLICGKASKINVISKPYGGVATVTNDREIMFTPDPEFSGKTFLTYEVILENGEKHQTDLFIDLLK